MTIGSRVALLGAILAVSVIGCAYLQDLREDVVAAGGPALEATVAEELPRLGDSTLEDGTEISAGYLAGLATRYAARFIPALLARRRRRRDREA